MTAFQFWQSVATTPWWLMLFFVYILFLGYYATKPQIIPVNNLKFGALAIFSMSLIGMFVFLHFTVTNVITWSIATAAGITFGYLQFLAQKVKAVTGVQNKKLIHFRGTWLVLMVITALTAAKYYYGYKLSTFDPRFISRPENGHILSSLYGLATGMFLGRLLYAMRVVKNGPYVSIKQLESN